MTHFAIRVHVFCEGQTEETFVREVLQEHFNRQGIFLNPIIVRTSKAGKGGVTSYAKIKWQIEYKCKEDPQAWVTTLFDYYGLPKDFPEKFSADKIVDPYRKVAHLEKKFEEDINQGNFISNLFLHEYEALLFSGVDKFGEWFGEHANRALSGEQNDFKTPEQFNNNVNTAPSKRILKHCEAYDKPVHGALIAMDIGLDVIRKSCVHFNKWLTRIELLAS